MKYVRQAVALGTYGNVWGSKIRRTWSSAGLSAWLGVRIGADAAIPRGLQAALMAVQRGGNRNGGQYGPAGLIW